MNETHWQNPNKPSRIYTIGYGLTTEEAFIQRLKDAFPDGDAMIIDIRKKGSGSRNKGTWANWGAPMISTIWGSGNQAEFFPELANPHGNTKAGLEKYGNELHTGFRRKYVDILVSDMVEHPETQYCLLCCERKPYTGKFTPSSAYKAKYGGWESWTGRPNCHRILVAREIISRMRIDYKLEWFMKNLYTEG